MKGIYNIVLFQNNAFLYMLFIITPLWFTSRLKSTIIATGNRNSCYQQKRYSDGNAFLLMLSVYHTLSVIWECLQNVIYFDQFLDMSTAKSTQINYIASRKS